MKNKLSIDARWLLGGIGTYTSHLLQGLATRSGDLEVHAITREQHSAFVSQWCRRVTVVNLPIYTMREQWIIPRAAAGCDLLHVPHYNVPLLSRAPMVMTIHDIIHITDSHYRTTLKSRAYARPVLRLGARRARHVITDSQFSKAQIIEYLGVSPDKVSAIPCGVSAEFRPMHREEARQSVATALGICEPYLLYVGSLKPHKNVPSLLRAFALLRERRDVPQRLLILGDVPPEIRPLAKECARLGISERVDTVYQLERGLLPKVYAAADALVLPSRIEGFGLPVLEAMACGTPVVCSRAASLPEVGGDAVVYFDPQSPEDLADALERVLSSRDLWQSLRTRGLTRAAQFSWQGAVDMHIQVYRSVLG